MKTIALASAVSLASALLPFTLAEVQACVNPTNGMVVTQDTVFCSGTFNLPQGITIGAGNITVEGNNTIIRGSSSTTGQGLTATGRGHVTVRNLTIQRYKYGMRFNDCDDLTVENCTVAETYNDCPTGDCDFLNIFDGPNGTYGHALWLRFCDRATIRQNQVGGGVRWHLGELEALLTTTLQRWLGARDEGIRQIRAHPAVVLRVEPRALEFLSR